MAVNLPSELTTIILEYAYYDANGQPDRRTLSACTLLCTSWSAVAQPLLFRHVCAPSSKDHENRLAIFRSTLLSGSEHGRILAAQVRRAEVAIRDLADVEIFVELIYHCHHLYELILRVHGVHAFQSSTLEALGAPAIIGRPAPIRALALLSCGIQSPILYQLLATWPTIRFLRLGTELAAHPPTDMPIRASLYELSLARTPCVEGMGWLLSNSQGTLRIFECHAAPEGAHREILAAHTAHLLSLRLFRHTFGVPALLRRCSSLREVMLTQVSDFLPLGELPAALEHLTFRHFMSTHSVLPPSILEAIEKLPKLRLVSCDVSARLATNYAALEEKCTQKGVVLDHDVVPIRAFEDPIPLVRFPRGRSVDNLRYMNPEAQED
ncbi:uncharacterized protein PHACADRAFT_178956 [Phanerochaete carnosa HHB-10118-sp]|uniref:F-box domain-containing protein n=1 Tax=Phanerochaete carnosa (strain HHB-10118-sp) TaxID=650164 RepID=K5VSJ0_PHACS|nr:uncharacterized protein PHACADRAFT_178956 [Phanerochaete carnosa HHB-10118-sp]EKM49534.1 hypothetical protein PHACADRAFT_178956 [Phanerochaete carnosa HHB-10118-sp]